MPIALGSFSDMRSDIQPHGKGRPNRLTILFVCIHNAGRSQMAASFTTKLGGGHIEASSAGSHPCHRIHSNVIEVMREVGVDLSKESPKLLDEEALRRADIVVTMGCGDSCPVQPGKRRMDWNIEDPMGKGIEDVRGIRDEIRVRVESLVSELTVGDPRPR